MIFSLDHLFGIHKDEIALAESRTKKVHTSKEIYYLDLFLFIAHSPHQFTSVTFLSLPNANPSSSTIDYKFDRVSLPSSSHHHHQQHRIRMHTLCSFVGSHSRNKRETTTGRNQNVYSEFFISIFYLQSVAELLSRKTPNARTCAIPMVMRNATGVLPSAISCVHVVCAYSLTCSETDRDRLIWFSHSHIRCPPLTKLVGIA